MKDYPNSWYESAWLNRPDIQVEFSLESGKETIVPGTIIKFKNMTGTYKFRCLAKNTVTGKEWIECIDMKYGTFRSFYSDRLKGAVKPVRRRKRKSQPK